MRRLFNFAALLVLFLAPAHAPAQVVGDGRLVEQASVALPAYEQLSDRLKRLYTREAVERVRGAADLELLRVRYTSDGLKVVGFIYKPKRTDGRRLPAVIWNRGGAGGDALIGPANFFALHEMHRYASEGFVELVVYAKDDHFVTLNQEDRLRRSVEWFKNPRTVPVSLALRGAVREGGVEAAVALYHEMKKGPRASRYDFAEPHLNGLGYELLAAGRVREAVEIFKLNVAAYPAEFNTYDSLAEAYAAAGQKEPAILNYKKSLELNPQNANAAEALKRLEGKQTAGQTPSHGTEDDVAAVRRAVEKLVRDFNARDAKAVMSNFAADVVLVSPHHPEVGYETMEEGFSRAYEKPPATPYSAVTKIEEVEVSGDLAFVRLVWLREAKDDGRLLRREKDFEIWRRQPDGRWKLARGYSFTFEGDFPVAEPRAAAAPGALTRAQERASDARLRRQPAPNAREDTNAVKAALEKLLGAYNRRDLEAAMAAYAPDSLLSYPGTPDSGNAQARAAYARRFAAAPPSPVTISFRLEELQTSGDLAFARLLWLVERDSDKKTLSRHKDLEVWKRQPGGGWALYRGLSFHMPPD